VLCRLAALQSCFDMEAAATVAEDGQFHANVVFDTLASLVAKSLLVTQPSGDRMLYRCSETTRAYALEKLQHLIAM